MNSRVHPKYKTKYRVSNWAEYDRALAQRGDITLWISADAADTWSPEPSRKRGGQRKFSDQAIETAARGAKVVVPPSKDSDEIKAIRRSRSHSQTSKEGMAELGRAQSFAMK